MLIWRLWVTLNVAGLLLISVDKQWPKECSMRVRNLCNLTRFVYSPRYSLLQYARSSFALNSVLRLGSLKWRIYFQIANITEIKRHNEIGLRWYNNIYKFPKIIARQSKIINIVGIVFAKIYENENLDVFVYNTSSHVDWIIVEPEKPRNFFIWYEVILYMRYLDVRYIFSVCSTVRVILELVLYCDWTRKSVSELYENKRSESFALLMSNPRC